MSSATSNVETRTLTFRRYKDGDAEPLAWQQEIFDADHSHKCPTYIQSTPPCQGSCPSGEDIRGYLNIVRGVEKPPAGVPWQEYAWRRLTEANPFPSVMGRVCPAPCESGCNRNQVEDFVGINSVEHFLGEYAIANNLRFVRPEQSSGKKVAVIGGGPAGLSAAYQLARQGHALTTFYDRAELGVEQRVVEERGRHADRGGRPALAGIDDRVGELADAQVLLGDGLRHLVPERRALLDPRGERRWAARAGRRDLEPRLDRPLAGALLPVLDELAVGRR
ncbi:MAG TPA: NAD(P)-binding protein, partial [Burkholderiaceae bacterium]|nr:NAD(P)-binding protein [Burkholderiaceae bacterium]